MTPQLFSELLRTDPVAAINAVGEGQVDPNGRNNGVPALMEALMQNETGIVYLLLKQKADPNAYADGQSLLRGLAPIHVTRNPDMVDALIKAHAHIDAPVQQLDRSWGMKGETALHIAVVSGNRELAVALLSHGPDTNLPFNKQPPETVNFVMDQAFSIRASQTLPKGLANLILSDVARREHNQEAEKKAEKQAPIPMTAAGLAQMREAINAHLASTQNIEMMHFESPGNPQPTFLASVSHALGKLAGSLVGNMKSAFSAIETRLAYDGLQPQTGLEKTSSVLQALNGAASIFMANAKVQMREFQAQMSAVSEKPETPSAQ